MTFHDANACFSASRRRFVQGVACAGVAGSLGFARRLFAADAANRAILSGREFDLTIGEMPVDFTGATRRATVVNGQLPAPLLRWRQGDAVTLRVRNALPVRSSIHWHGIILPADMDGVPGLSFMGIAPGETYTYRFTVNQAGTYWYHSHSRFQEQIGLYGPIVIEPRGGERFPTDREHVVLLSDWTDADPERIYATLKKQANYYNYGKQTAGDFLRDVSDEGVKAALASRRMWNTMRMDPSDLADVSAAAYTYLMNGVPPARNSTALFARGERVKLRFVNGASMTVFDVRIPGLSMKVVAADGQDIAPVSVDEFRIGPAETYDVIVQPRDARAARKRRGRSAAARSAPAADDARHDGRDGAWLDGEHAGHGSRLDGGHGSRRCESGAPCGGGVRPRRRPARRHAPHEPRRSRSRPAR
jgi:CopA family copper-resistance protein